jgi:hypothetical protein
MIGGMKKNNIESIGKCPIHKIKIHYAGERYGEKVYYCKLCRSYFTENVIEKWKI